MHNLDTAAALRFNLVTTSKFVKKCQKNPFCSRGYKVFSNVVEQKFVHPGVAKVFFSVVKKIEKYNDNEEKNFGAMTA